MYIFEIGTWRDGGRLRTYQSPTGELALSNSHIGTWRNDGGDMEQLPHQTEHSQTTGYIIERCLAAEPLFCVITGVMQRHFLSPPVPWWLLL
jgi:hypothetical protein